MAYISIPYPQVLYDGTGLPVTVRNADHAATLPTTFVPVPTTVAALVAFPPAVIAQVVTQPLPLTLPATLKIAISAQAPKRSRSHDEREN